MIKTFTIMKLYLGDATLMFKVSFLKCDFNKIIIIN